MYAVIVARMSCHGFVCTACGVVISGVFSVTNAFTEYT
jgi:succinate dehydrogenase/fumarate reductase-like Fe-S protein